VFRLEAGAAVGAQRSGTLAVLEIRENA
jgi:hypothetical protein